MTFTHDGNNNKTLKHGVFMKVCQLGWCSYRTYSSMQGFTPGQLELFFSDLSFLESVQQQIISSLHVYERLGISESVLTLFVEKCANMSLYTDHTGVCVWSRSTFHMFCLLWA